jgi:hypothetical protein
VSRAIVALRRTRDALSSPNRDVCEARFSAAMRVAERLGKIANAQMFGKLCPQQGTAPKCHAHALEWLKRRLATMLRGNFESER